MSAPAQHGGRPRQHLDGLAGRLRGAGPEYPLGLSIIAVAIAAPVFIRLSAAGSQSDIPAHAARAASMVQSGGWLSYTLWYPLIYLTSSGSTDPAVLRDLSVSFLLIAVIAKTLLAFYYSWTSTRQRTGSAIIALLMLVAMPVMNPWHSNNIYSGQISPNIWHNSTQIFALPFSLSAFIAAVALLRAQTIQRAALCGLMILGSTLAKPNYALALLPVLGLMLLWNMVRAKIPVPRLIAVVGLTFLPTTLLLMYQYLLVYGQDGVASATLAYAPFATWPHFSSNIPLSICLSIAGPLIVFLVIPRKHRSDPALVLSWLVLGVSVVQLALLAEKRLTGEIALAGDLFWGTFSAIFMLFIASAIALAREYASGPHSRSHRVALFAAVMVLTMHAASGIYYLERAGVAGYPVFVRH